MRQTRSGSTRATLVAAKLEGSTGRRGLRLAEIVGAKILRGRRVLFVLIVMLVSACTWVWARSAASVSVAPTAVLTVDTHLPGNVFVPGSVGLSTEAHELNSGRLSVDHPSLVRLMRLLGPSVLRIGGDSVDTSWWTNTDEPAPPWATNIVTPADLSTLRKLLTATRWRVLLGVDLGHFEPARVANEARYAREILGPDLLGIEIGNEPDSYGSKNENSSTPLRAPSYGVGEYLREAKAYSQSLHQAAPSVALYGPSLTQNNSWLIQMGIAARMFAQISQHYYPTSTCSQAPPSEPPPTVEGLLSPAVRRNEDENLQALALAGHVAGRPTRIGETNNTACMGSPSASPTFASALWALDWALRAVSSGVEGLNFHGVLGFCDANTVSPICATRGEAVSAGDVTAQPEFYGLLAARQLEGGRFVPTSVIAPQPLPNLTTWATVAPSGEVRIAIDNMTTGGLAQPVLIHVSGYAVSYEMLTAPSVEARTGITLGGADATRLGHWRPKPIQINRQHSLRISVPPASAILVTLHRRRQGRRHT